jgi:uncharacterized membrane protein
LAIDEFPTPVVLRGSSVAISRDPVKVFVAISVLFGSAIIIATPPLRGPDETAHFLRAYGIALGDIVPSVRDAEDRKGVLLPARFYSQFDHFESARVKEKTAGWSGYGPVLRAYFRDRIPPNEAPARLVFVPYAGSEGYSPVAYLPQVAAALAARAMDLDFAATLYLMRFAGLVAMTAMIAYAIAVAPQVAWTFSAIALLPASLYGRSVISADGSALGAAILVAALWLRGFSCTNGHRPALLSFWLMLGALTKPTNAAFALLGLMMPKRRWAAAVLATLPAVVAAGSWSLLSGADTAGWRMVEITGQPPVAFDPVVKLDYWLHHPSHFPAAMISAIHEKHLGELWQQVIGVLGLFDTVLDGRVYPTLSVLLLGTFFTRLHLTRAARVQVATTGVIVTLAYVIAVYLVCYLSFTPLDANTVWGVQGRYFVLCFPIAAIVVAAMMNRGPDQRITAALAISVGVLTGIASVHAILRTDWHM